jgi:hypothetical protein
VLQVILVYQNGQLQAHWAVLCQWFHGPQGLAMAPVTDPDYNAIKQRRYRERLRVREAAQEAASPWVSAGTISIIVPAMTPRRTAAAHTYEPQSDEPAHA